MRVAAGAMEGMMGAWNIMKKHGINKPEWLSYCKKYADWLVRNQEKDGSFYLRYDWRTGKPTHDSKYTTTNIIRFLIELYSVTQDKRYLDTALKAGEFSYDFIHHDYLYVGGVIDNPNVKDRESGQMAIYAFLALYDVTSDAKWKEAAIQAARYTETFMFAYHVPMAINDTLTDFPKDVKYCRANPDCYRTLCNRQRTGFLFLSVLSLIPHDERYAFPGNGKADSKQYSFHYGSEWRHEIPLQRFAYGMLQPAIQSWT